MIVNNNKKKKKKKYDKNDKKKIKIAGHKFMAEIAIISDSWHY